MSNVSISKERTRARKPSTTEPWASVGLPQVNLLPPEVQTARSLRTTKRWLAAGLAAVLVLLAVGYGGAHLVRGAADAQLADAQAETARLKAEEAKYAEVVQVLKAVEDTELAREIGMSTETRWKTYVDAITAVLPAGVSVESFILVGASPTTAPPVPTDPLQTPGVGSITFEGRTKTMPDTAAWLDALASVPGFADPWVSAVSVTEEEGGVFYSVSTSVQLTPSTFLHRFSAQPEAN